MILRTPSAGRSKPKLEYWSYGSDMLPPVGIDGSLGRLRVLAANRNGFTGQVRRIVTGQPDDGVGDFPQLGAPTEYFLFEQLFERGGGPPLAQRIVLAAA